MYILQRRHSQPAQHIILLVASVVYFFQSHSFRYRGYTDSMMSKASTKDKLTERLSSQSAKSPAPKVEQDHNLPQTLAGDDLPTEFDSIHPSEFTDPQPPVDLTEQKQQQPVKNAFSILLSSSKDSSRKRQHRSSSPTTSPNRTPKPDPTRRTHPPNWRNCFAPYLSNPTNYPPTVVLRHTPDFVTIFDAYPKSTIHLLILPRDSTINTLHPIEVFNTHPELLQKVREEVSVLNPILQKEMRRRHGDLSHTQNLHNNALDDTSEESALPVPPPRNYDIKVGIHAHPSITHLHIHVLTPDMVNPCLKHKKHYNSFASGFFIPLDDFPMAEDDYRRTHPGRDEKSGKVYLKGDMKCWRCGRNFGGRFTQLKEHLVQERAEWLAE